MIQSMTGYAYKENFSEKRVICVEIKSVNSRYLDIFVSLPQFLNPLESYFRTKISEKVNRGKIDVFIKIKENSSDAKIISDTKMAKNYYDEIKKIARSLKIKDKEIPLSLIVNLPGVLNSDKSYDVEEYKKEIEPVFFNALDEFVKDRKREGENMKNDLLSKLVRLDECADFFSEWQPKMEESFKTQITLKFHELLGENADENRIMSETAAMLVKYTINEEIVRLKSHLKAMRFELENNFVPGKKLDFLCQEINREINTIGSKSQFEQVSSMVINAKDSLENIREQAKNIE